MRWKHQLRLLASPCTEQPCLQRVNRHVSQSTHRNSPSFALLMKGLRKDGLWCSGPKSHSTIGNAAIVGVRINDNPSCPDIIIALSSPTGASCNPLKTMESFDLETHLLLPRVIRQRQHRSRPPVRVGHCLTFRQSTGTQHA